MLVDAHTHLELLSIHSAELAGAESVAQVRELVSAAKGPLVLWGWREELLGEPLRRKHIDDIPVPLLLLRIDCHVGVLNRAMEALLSPKPSRFFDPVRGYLYETALWRAVNRLKPRGRAMERALRRALSCARSLGLDEVHDFVDAELARIYVGIGELPLRVVLMPYYEDYREVTALVRGTESPDLSLGWVKVFVDGSISARTAYLKEPYADREEWRGLLLKDRHRLAEIVRELEEKGLRVAFHAIGDAAVEECLRAFELAVPRLPYHRIEHAELVTEEQALRIRDLRVLLCVQPGFRSFFRGTYLKALGEERASRVIPLRMLDRLGVDMIFGSDMMPFDPSYCLESAADALGRERAEYYYGGWRDEGRYL